MAKQKKEKSQAKSSANENNPFYHIPFSSSDLKDPAGGGGGGKELVLVDAAYRKNLSRALIEAGTAILEGLQKYPDSLGCLVIKLRDIGIAKTHRPTQLVEESRVIPAGHSHINEMLVGVNSANLQNLDYLIRHRDVKAIRCNLSAIENFLPWTSAKRCPEGAQILKERDRGILRLFKYADHKLTGQNLDHIKNLLHKLGLKIQEISQPRGLPIFQVLGLKRLNEDAFTYLLQHPGIRSFYADQVVASSTTKTTSTSAIAVLPPPAKSLPTVGVFDTGVSAGATALSSWITGSNVYVLPPETDYAHGTAVASAVIGASHLNGGHASLPKGGCLVHNACALESQNANISDLMIRLEDVVKKNQQIKVWNLSLGSKLPCYEQEFSDFAMKLDQLSDQYGVLFVVAAGNYEDLPRRGWPVGGTLFNDRISSPADSVRALTVGSVAHLDGTSTLVASGDPAPYSRRGPGPVFTMKPDIVHAGGGVHLPWAAGPTSLRVVLPNNDVGYNFGTSFAAPISAAMAAQAWDTLNGHKNLTPNPSLIKGLMIHAAQLTNRSYSFEERRYYGTGLPEDVLSILFDSDESFTLVFNAKLVPGLRWRKAPYPIPSALLHNGKFRGEIIITAAYAPPIDSNAGAEYVRANMELSFGTLNGDRISGKVPMEGEIGTTGYENAQIEHGGKWAPVKVHRKSFPNGTGEGDWALQAIARLREYEPPLQQAIEATIIVTLRSLDGDPNVYASGLRALAQRNWVYHQLPQRVPVTV